MDPPGPAMELAEPGFSTHRLRTAPSRRARPCPADGPRANGPERRPSGPWRDPNRSRISRMGGDQLPSLEALRCFAEAARLLNFRAAARAVGLTPAALGQRIRQLEELLDAKLFHRTTRTVTLTEEGLALVPFAHRTLDAAAECVRAGRGEVGPPPMELTLGTRHELGISWLVPLLPRLRKAQPGLTVHTYFGSGPDLVHRVRTLQIDCAVTSSVLTDPQ